MDNISECCGGGLWDKGPELTGSCCPFVCAMVASLTLLWCYIIFCHWFDIEPEKHIWCQLARCFANRLCYCSGVCLRPHQFDGSRHRNTIYCCVQGDYSKGGWVGRLQAQVPGSKDSSYLWFQEGGKKSSPNYWATTTLQLSDNKAAAHGLRGI